MFNQDIENRKEKFSLNKTETKRAVLLLLTRSKAGRLVKIERGKKMHTLIALLLVLCTHMNYAQAICYSKALQKTFANPTTTATTASAAPGATATATTPTESATRSATLLINSSKTIIDTTTIAPPPTSVSHDCDQQLRGERSPMARQLENSFNYNTSRLQSLTTTVTNISKTTTNLTDTILELPTALVTAKLSDISTSAKDELTGLTDAQTSNGNNAFQGIATSDPNVAATLGPELTVNYLNDFRLEYNKYKILSHLKIQSDPETISASIDDDLRTRLTASTAFTDARVSSSGSRRKRSLSCDQVKSNKDACCLENFYVNFTHIGWDKWIIYPPGYNANYCRGQCDLSHARYYHSTLLSKYNNVISLCCSPKQMAPLRLLYIDESNKVHEKSIPEMVVESCDCA